MLVKKAALLKTYRNNKTAKNKRARDPSYRVKKTKKLPPQ